MRIHRLCVWVTYSLITGSEQTHTTKQKASARRTPTGELHYDTQGLNNTLLSDCNPLRIDNTQAPHTEAQKTFTMTENRLYK